MRRPCYACTSFSICFNFIFSCSILEFWPILSGCTFFLHLVLCLNALFVLTKYDKKKNYFSLFWWQEELLPLVQSANLTLSFSSESSIEDELKRESTADVITIAVSNWNWFFYGVTLLWIFSSFGFLLFSSNACDITSGQLSGNVCVCVSDLGRCITVLFYLCLIQGVILAVFSYMRNHFWGTFTVFHAALNYVHLCSNFWSCTCWVWILIMI